MMGAFCFVMPLFLLGGADDYLMMLCRKSHWFHTIAMSRTELDRVFNNTAMKKRSVVVYDNRNFLPAQ